MRFILALLSTSATALFVDNMVAKTNASGAIMDAHDGTYNQWQEGGDWYFYAMGYGLCTQGGDLCHGCGYGYSWIGVWRSADLGDGSWELLRDARDDTWPRWGGAYFRVHVVKNPATGLYVLWVNADGAPQCPPGNQRSCWLVGTATEPEGPFTYRGASGSRFPDGGDFDILVDDDGAGYIIYTSTSQGHKMSVERLSDDFLVSLDSPSPAPAPTPPSPPAPILGFDLLGEGACRDSSDTEPQFYTNEDSTFKDMSQVDCADACSADDACTAFSWCSGEGAGKSCEGACHVYVTSLTSPGVQGWTLKSQGRGDAAAIDRVTSGEAWWRCQSKESSPSGFDPVGRGACRDHQGVEPQFYTDEGSSLQPMTQNACAVACADSSACTAYSWCSGAGAGASCSGACHIYVSALKPPEGDGWTQKFPGQGDASAIDRVTSNEDWWRCEVKKSGQRRPALLASSDGPTTTSSGYFGNEFVEAPALFKRKGTYYALFGKCCCFCGHGSGIGAYTAAHPLGPWTYHLNIGCGGDEPAPGCGCGMNQGSCSSGYGKSITKAQQNFVFPVQTPSGTEYIWTGDRWESSSDGIKAHDLQYWTPLTWARDEVSGLDLPQRLTWLDNFTLATRVMSDDDGLQV